MSDDKMSLAQVVETKEESEQTQAAVVVENKPTHPGPGGPHRFAPNNVANPAGRPKIVREVALLARSYTTDAIRVLASIMLSKKAHTPSRVRAAELLLERGYGKAPAVLNVVHHLGSQELEDAARAILKKRDEATKPKVIEATLTKK